MRDAVIAAHAAWSRDVAAAVEPPSAAADAAAEEDLGGEGFTMVDGLDEEGSAAAPPVPATAATEGDPSVRLAADFVRRTHG